MQINESYYNAYEFLGDIAYVEENFEEARIMFMKYLEYDNSNHEVLEKLKGVEMYDG